MRSEQVESHWWFNWTSSVISVILKDMRIIADVSFFHLSVQIPLNINREISVQLSKAHRQGKRRNTSQILHKRWCYNISHVLHSTTLPTSASRFINTQLSGCYQLQWLTILDKLTNDWTWISLVWVECINSPTATYQIYISNMQIVKMTITWWKTSWQ